MMWQRVRRHRRRYEDNPAVAGGLLPLSRLPAGRRGVVARLLGGRGLESRLAALGLTVGAEVTLLQNYGHGPLLITVRDTRLALGRGEASHILVRPC